MKRILSAVIVILLVFALCSCGGQPESEAVPEYQLDAETENFAGMEISFFGDTDLFFRYEAHSPAYDALVKRIREVESRYNCKITYNSSSSADSLVTASFAAGEPLSDALFLDAKPFRTLAAGGYLLDLNSYSDIIDVNDSFRWGSKNVLEICCCNGHLYGVTPAAWVDKMSPYYFLVVTNDDIVMKNGYSDPHEYYENKTWNRTLFEEMVRNCADLDAGIYGIDTSAEFIGRMAVYSDGIGLTDTSSATPRSTWHSASVLDNLQWAADFVAANKQYITQKGESYDLFIEGKSAMAMPAIHHFCRKIIFTTAMSSYSVMPFPCSDAAEPGTCGGFFSTGLDTISMPVLTTTETETATVINAMWAPMEGYETEDALDSYYISNIFFKSADLEIYKNCVSNSRYNYWVEKVFTPLENIISLVVSGQSTPSQAVEQYIDAADEVIANVVVPNETGLSEYFNN